MSCIVASVESLSTLSIDNSSLGQIFLGMGGWEGGLHFHDIAGASYIHLFIAGMKQWHGSVLSSMFHTTW